MHASLLDALSHMLAGASSAARKAAEAVLTRSARSASGPRAGQRAQLRALAHLLAAEGAQACRTAPAARNT
jgi:HemY protein